MKYYSEIIGTGCAFPKTVMTNKDFEGFLETSDEWIRSRTGISTRRIANTREGESTLTFANEAAVKALAMAGISGSDLELIIVGTVTPETTMPSTANYLQDLLGANKAFSFDMQAACSGFLYGLSIADKYIQAGETKYVLVIGAETLSTVVNWQDRTTCILFGDGAGAVILKRTESDKHCVLTTRLYSDGTKKELLKIPHGYSKVPPYSADYQTHQHKIQMQGSEVFKIAVRNMINASQAVLNDNKMKIEDVDFFIFHQANIRIIDMCLKTLGVPLEKTWINIDKYGNTSAATLPACLDEAWKAGKVKKGDVILMATFGGGLTWASSLIRL